MSEITIEEFYARVKWCDPNARIAPVGESKFPHLGYDGFPPRPVTPGAFRYVLKRHPSPEVAHDLPIATALRPITPLLAQRVELHSTSNAELETAILAILDFTSEKGGNP